MKKYNSIKSITIIAYVLATLFLCFQYFMLKKNILIDAILVAVFAILSILCFAVFASLRKENIASIEKRLDASSKLAIDEAKVGVLMYNENYVISWMSSFFKERNLEKVGEKVLNWLPELQDLLQGSISSQVVIINDEKYNVTRKDDSYALLFKDISVEYDLNKLVEDNAYVLGVVSYDNYDESSESEDDIQYVNANIKIPVVDYFKKFNITYKTLRNNRMLLILNEKEFASLKNDRFSILNIVRKEAKKADLDITLSMAFAHGSDSFEELDEMAQSLIELAQSRGGDQVVVRKVNEEAIFYGGSSEAREKQSKIRARVMTNTIKDLILKSSNVIIVGHNDMDSDCVGAALCMSSIVSSLGKDAYIVYKNVNVESMISEVMQRYKSVISERHNYIDESQALGLLNDDSLVIMVDHHSKLQSSCKNLLDVAKRIMIIDHHRRSADLDVDPLLVYIEASASSTVELVCEFLLYLGKRVSICEQEANVMYLGIMIDTGRFRTRTGARTFDVAKTLRNYGADPVECDVLSEEPYESVLKRSSIIGSAKKYKDNILVSCVDAIIPRSIASQACDEMVKVKNIEAAFVICLSDKDEVLVSARSNGKINVQVIMEKLNGGGHMTAAGLQRKNCDINELKDELINVLDSYLKGDLSNESNIVK